MTASQPQGAPNTAGSVSTDTATGPDPYRATQGENDLHYGKPMHYGVMYPDGTVGSFAIGVPVLFDRWRQVLADGSLGYPLGAKLVQRADYASPWEPVEFPNPSTLETAP